METIECYTCEKQISPDDIAEDPDGTTYNICPDCQDSVITEWTD